MQVKLYKTPVSKDDVRVLYDFWLLGEVDNRKIAVRIDATFRHDFFKLFKLATDTSDDDLKKLSRPTD